MLLAWALLGPLAIAGCSTGSTAPTGPPTLREVEALLARHGAAVRAHSAKRFLADVDTAPSAAAFRARQSRQISNIADVPFASFRYAAVSPVTSPGAAADATRRLHAPALIVHVRLSYELGGIDSAPDRHDLWWTFVRRDGRVYLAGDDALAQAGGASWRGPWDFGPVVVVRGAHSLVLGHIGDALQLGGLADAVDEAVPAVDGVWGGDWSQRVAVLVPGSQAEFEALVGSGTGYQDVSAVAITAGTDATTGRPYGQRLVMDPAALGTLSDTGRQIVVRHELTHLATAADTSQTTPRWLVEGFAEFVGERGSGQPVRTAAAELAENVRAGALPAHLPGDAAFAAGAADRARAYEQAWLACRLIARRAGVAGLVSFYREVGRAVLPPAYAVKGAFADVLHVSLARFTAQWRQYLTEQLSR